MWRSPLPDPRRAGNGARRAPRVRVSRIRAFIVGCALATSAIAGCHGKSDDEAPARPPTVRVVTVAERTLAPRIAVAGVLAPLPGRDVRVGALVQGRIDRLFVAEGDVVKVGQALAHVEAEPLRRHVSEADAQRETSRAALENARARLSRTERLFKDGITAGQEVDDARAAVVAAESSEKQAQAGGGIARANLDRATLRAPIAGVVAAVLVPAGQPVDGNGAAVIEIADTRVLDLRAPVPASAIAAVVIGQRASIVVDGDGDGPGESFAGDTLGGDGDGAAGDEVLVRRRRIAGVVEAIAPLVDVATGTVLVRVRVDNPGRRLRGGMYARGVLLAAPRAALMVPRSALLPGDGGDASTVALVLGDGKVAHRAVAIGAASGDQLEVLRGLRVGDRVISAGGYALPDGAEVEVAP